MGIVKMKHVLKICVLQQLRASFQCLSAQLETFIYKLTSILQCAEKEINQAQNG